MRIDDGNDNNTFEYALDDAAQTDNPATAPADYGTPDAVPDNTPAPDYGTPDAIIRKVSADLRVALEDNGVQSKLAAIGTYVQPMTPEELTAFIQEQQRVWKPVAEAVAGAQKK